MTTAHTLKYAAIVFAVYMAGQLPMWASDVLADAATKF